MDQGSEGRARPDRARGLPAPITATGRPATTPALPTEMQYLLPAHVAAAFMGARGQGPVLDVGAGTGLLAERSARHGLQGPDRRGWISRPRCWSARRKSASMPACSRPISPSPWTCRAAMAASSVRAPSPLAMSVPRPCRTCCRSPGPAPVRPVDQPAGLDRGGLRPRAGRPWPREADHRPAADRGRGLRRRRRRAGRRTCRRPRADRAVPRGLSAVINRFTCGPGPVSAYMPDQFAGPAMQTTLTPSILAPKPRQPKASPTPPLPSTGWRRCIPRRPHFLSDQFLRTVTKGHPGRRIRAFYPEIRLTVDQLRQGRHAPCPLAMSPAPAPMPPRSRGPTSSATT